MVNPKTLLFLLAFLFLSRLLYGQNDNNANYDPSEVNHIYQQVKAYERYLNAIKERNTELLDKPIRKEYAAIITQKNNELLNQINGRGFLFDSIAYPFLTSVFTRVIDKNHLNRDQFHFFCDRTGEVNAYSFEDGTIVCNLKTC